LAIPQAGVNDLVTTQQLAWVLGRSTGTIRDQIKAGEIEATRIVGGFRIPKSEALRLAREKVEAETGGKISDAKLERLVDEVISTNESP
jgi:excisionase family DNA binding protein